MLLRNSTDKTAKGEAAETTAEQFLQHLGLRTLEKNFRCRLGEIDLIMMHGETLVFVEVRLRTNPYFSSAAESVNSKKQQKIIRTAQLYLQQHQLSERVSCRFDVVTLARADAAAKPEWIQNAFGGF